MRWLQWRITVPSDDVWHRFWTEKEESRKFTSDTTSAMSLSTGDKKNTRTPKELWEVLIQKVCAISFAYYDVYCVWKLFEVTIQRNIFILVSRPLNDIVTKCSITALYTCYFCLQSWRDSNEEIATPCGEGCDIFWTNKDLLRCLPQVTQHTERCTSISCVTGMYDIRCRTSLTTFSCLLIWSKGDLTEHDSSGHCVRWLVLLLLAALVAIMLELSSSQQQLWRVQTSGL
jgi:hypothetical protein